MYALSVTGVSKELEVFSQSVQLCFLHSDMLSHVKERNDPVPEAKN